MSFEMTGVVTDEGRPVPGAKVTVILDPYMSDGTEPSVLTDGSGGYQVNFTGVPGGNRGPAGTEQAVAFAQVEAPGYERFARYVLGTTPHLVENFHVHPIRRVTAGESAVLTIAPDDGVCAIDVTPARELICGFVHLLAPRDGIMTVAAVPTQGAAALPVVEAYGGNTGSAPANPTALRVAAGIEYTVEVQVPWGINASQSFTLTTSVTLR
jgi:hypothetical protein